MGSLLLDYALCWGAWQWLFILVKGVIRRNFAATLADLRQRFGGASLALFAGAALCTGLLVAPMARDYTAMAFSNGLLAFKSALAFFLFFSQFAIAVVTRVSVKRELFCIAATTVSFAFLTLAEIAFLMAEDPRPSF